MPISQKKRIKNGYGTTILRDKMLCGSFCPTFSAENNCHLRDGRKTLHRSVFFLALSNPVQILKQKNTAHRLVYRVFGALQGIRTPDLLVRSQTLYPAELAAQMRFKYSFDRRNIIPPTAENVNRFFDFFYCAEFMFFDRRAVGVNCVCRRREQNSPNSGTLRREQAPALLYYNRHFPLPGESPRPTL